MRNFELLKFEGDSVETVAEVRLDLDNEGTLNRQVIRSINRQGFFGAVEIDADLSTGVIGVTNEDGELVFQLRESA